MQMKLSDRTNRRNRWAKDILTGLDLDPNAPIAVANLEFLSLLSSKFHMPCVDKPHVWQSASEILFSEFGFETGEHDFALAAAVMCLESLDRLDSYLSRSNKSHALLVLSEVVERLRSSLRCSHPQQTRLQEKLYKQILAPAVIQTGQGSGLAA